MKKISVFVSVLLITLVAYAALPERFKSGVIFDDQTASRALYVDSNKQLQSSAVTDTELGYLSGVTSALQTQIDAIDTFDELSPMTTAGDIIYGGASGTGTRLGVGTDDQVLTLVSGAPAWADASGGGAGAGAFVNLAAEQDLNWNAETGDTTNFAETGGGTLAIETTEVFQGANSISYDASAASDYVTFGPVDITSLDNNNCMASFWYKGFDANITAQVWDGTNVLNSETMVASTEWSRQEEGMSFVCNDATTSNLYIRLLADADAAIGYIDNAWVGENYRVGRIPNNEYEIKTLSSDITSSTTMSDLTFSDLVIGREYKVTLQAAQQSVSSTGTSTISITHNSTVIGLSKYDSASADNNGVQTSSVSVNFTAAATTLTFVSVASASNVIQGDGTQSETFAMLEEFTTSDGFSTNQTNRPWTAYTPTFTGFGTVSNVESYWKRQGEDMLLRINFTCGTPTTTEARVSLPGSYTSSSAIDSIELAGEGRRGAVASNQYGILIEPSVSYVTFSIQGSASNGTQKKNGDDICASGNAMIYTARVPIEGWDETMNAPLIKNSVVNSSDGVTSTEAAHINCDASSAVLSQHGSWVSSVGNVASGACAVTITTGIFSSTPYCWAIMNDSGFAATNYSLVVIPASSTSVSFDCYAGGDCTDFDVSLFCMGSK